MIVQVLLLAIALFFIIILFLALSISMGLIFYSKKNSAYILKQRLEWGEIPRDYKKEDWQQAWINTCEGSIFSQFLVHDPKKWVFLLHGAGQDHQSMLRFIPFYQDRGFSIVLYDQRGHGQSYSGRIQYGVAESRDLQSVVSFFREEFPGARQFLYHGESLGAVTVLLFQYYEDLQSLFICDAPFSSFDAILNFYLRKKISFFLIRSTVRKLIMLFLWISGLPIKEMNPINMPEYRKQRTLFIHGTEDRYVPCSMSEELLASWGEKGRGYFVKGGKHGNNWRIDPKKYENALSDFIFEYFS